MATNTTDRFVAKLILPDGKELRFLVDAHDLKGAAAEACQMLEDATLEITTYANFLRQ